MTEQKSTVCHRVPMILQVFLQLPNIRVLLYHIPFELCTAQPAAKDNKCNNQPVPGNLDNFNKKISTRITCKNI